MRNQYDAHDQLVRDVAQFGADSAEARNSSITYCTAAYIEPHYARMIRLPLQPVIEHPRDVEFLKITPVYRWQAEIARIVANAFPQ